MGPAEHDDGGSLQRCCQPGVLDIPFAHCPSMVLLVDVPSEICEFFVDPLQRHFELFLKGLAGSWRLIL